MRLITILFVLSLVACRKQPNIPQPCIALGQTQIVLPNDLKCEVVGSDGQTLVGDPFIIKWNGTNWDVTIGKVSFRANHGKTDTNHYVGEGYHLTVSALGSVVKAELLGIETITAVPPEIVDCWNQK